MRRVPALLRETQWGDWLNAAPPVVVDETGDAYRALALAWLDECPGHNSPLNDAEYEALEGWADSYRAELLKAKQERPGAGMDKLIFPVIGLTGAIMGPALVAGVGLTALAPAALVVSVGLGLVSIGYALPVVLKAIRKGRRWDLIEDIDKRLVALVATRVPPAPRPDQQR